MSLINQHSKLLALKVSEKIVVKNIVELVDRSNNNFGIATESNSQILGITSVIHNLDLSTSMLNTKDGLLKLTVDNDTVGDDQYRIKNVFIGGIVNRCENVGKPGNSLGLTTSCRMLNKIVAGGVVLNNIIHNTLHSTKLMETRENERLGLFDFAGVSIFAFLLFDIDETLDEEQDFILRPDILPHIGDIHAELIVGIALAEVLTDIEWVKEGIHAFQLRGEIHFV